MRNTIKCLMLAAALTMVWGCSSSDDDVTGGSGSSNTTFETAAAPEWEVNMQSSQEQPQWQPPVPSLYENKMIVMLRLQDELVPYSTDDDVMAVFIGGECRALSQRSGDLQTVYFVLNIYGENTSAPEEFALCYYSGGLKQEFWLRGENMFINETNFGTENDVVLDIMSGTTKYARQTVLNVTPKSSDGMTVDSDDDIVGVFVGGECRGVGRPGTDFNVFHQQNGEQAQLRYYSKSRGGIYTVRQSLTLTAGIEIVEIEI